MEQKEMKQNFRKQHEGMFTRFFENWTVDVVLWAVLGALIAWNIISNLSRWTALYRYFM